MSSPGNVATVLRLCDEWKAGNIEGILSLLAPDCFYHNIALNPLIGHDAIGASLRQVLSQVEAADYIMKYIAETIDGVVLTEQMSRFLVGGHWVNLPMMGAYELKRGKITHWRHYFDASQAFGVFGQSPP